MYVQTFEILKAFYSIERIIKVRDNMKIRLEKIRLYILKYFFFRENAKFR